MKRALTSHKLWELMFFTAILLFILDGYYQLKIFYLTVPLSFLLGVVTSVFTIREKKYLHTILCIAAILLLICLFV